MRVSDVGGSCQEAIILEARFLRYSTEGSLTSKWKWSQQLINFKNNIYFSQINMMTRPIKFDNRIAMY
jgi:hypothetical protein